MPALPALQSVRVSRRSPLEKVWARQTKALVEYPPVEHIFAKGGTFEFHGFTLAKGGNLTSARATFTFEGGILTGSVEYTSGSGGTQSQATKVTGKYDFDGIDEKPENFKRWEQYDEFFYREHFGGTDYCYSGKVVGDKLVGHYSEIQYPAEGTVQWNVVESLS